MENYANPAPDPRDVENGKTIGILAYCTLIGWIIAMVMHSSNKTRFGAFHIRQALGLFITAFAVVIVTFGVMFIMPFIGFLIPLVNVGVLVLLILGLVNAVNGKMEPVPLVGDFYNKLLSGIN
jgi:uncharacterized membrane protein